MHIVDFNCVNGSFEHKVSLEDGMRKEPNSSNLIKSTKNKYPDFQFKAKLSFSDFNYLKCLFRRLYDKLWKSNIDFSVFIKLYNEKIIINDLKEDTRSYGFCKIVIKDCLNNIYMDEIPILNSSLDSLKPALLQSIKLNVENVINIRNKEVNKIDLDSVPVVFSQKAAGYFIHEILGHSLEADFFSYYKNNFDNLKISDKLTVIDSIEGYENILGLNKYDDAGELIKPLTIIDKGKLCNIFCIDKKDSFDGKLYGCSRRESYKCNTMPRMRCTFIKPFDNIDKEKIISKYDFGVYFNNAYTGGVNPQTGEYNVVGNGFLLKDGEKYGFIDNLKLQGNLLNDLNSFEYIGNDLKIFGNYCSKLGQTVRVGVGGPTISLTNLSVEGNLYGKLY